MSRLESCRNPYYLIPAQTGLFFVSPKDLTLPISRKSKRTPTIWCKYFIDLFFLLYPQQSCITPPPIPPRANPGSQLHVSTTYITSGPDPETLPQPAAAVAQQQLQSTVKRQVSAGSVVVTTSTKKGPAPQPPHQPPGSKQMKDILLADNNVESS